MNIFKLIKTGLTRGGRFVKKHAPTILTVAGAGGAVTSVVLAVKATPKAMILIEQKKQREAKEKLTVLETVDACWKVYVPTAGTLVTAVACVIGANVLNLKTQAALLGLYSAQGELMKTYKDKVIEAIGPEEELNVRKKMVEEKLNGDPNFHIPTGLKPDEFPIYEEQTGQIIYGTKEMLKHAVSETRNVIHDCVDGVSLNSWLLTIGGNQVKLGDSIGWNDQTEFYVEIRTIDVKNMPCYWLDYEDCDPIPRYNFASE